MVSKARILAKDRMNSRKHFFQSHRYFPSPLSLPLVLDGLLYVEVTMEEWSGILMVS